MHAASGIRRFVSASLISTSLALALSTLRPAHADAKPKSPAALKSATAALAEKAEKLYEDGRHSEIYALLKSAVDEGEAGADVLWRLARACYEKGVASANNADKKKFYEDGLSYAKAAAAADDQNFAAHKWTGIMYNYVGEFQDTKAQISNAFVIRDHFVRAVTLNPKDATSHHLLGQWAWAIANVNWIKRQLAIALFATPPSASYDDCLTHFTNAENISPGFWKKNQLMLAKTCQQLKRKDEAKDWIAKCLALPVKTSEDREVQKEAEAFAKAV